jgi:hypothetical protein
MILTVQHILYMRFSWLRHGSRSPFIPTVVRIIDDHSLLEKKHYVQLTYALCLVKLKNDYPSFDEQHNQLTHC